MLLLLFLTAVLADPCDLLLRAPSLQLAEATLEQTVLEEPASCVARLIDHGSWEVAELLSNRTLLDSPKLIVEAKKRAMDQRRLIDRFLKALDFDSNLIYANAPALQWAQSPDKVFLEIQWAHRFDSPTCQEVADRKVSLTESRLELSGTCTQGNNLEKYSLAFDFFDLVDAEASTQSFVARGRGVLTLHKKQRGVWTQPMKGPAPPNMKVWADLRDRYAKEMAKFTEEA